MEELENKALTEALPPSKLWSMYVDDTGVVTKKFHEDESFETINQQHPVSNKFTIKKEDEDHSLPVFDLKLKREGNKIITHIY